MSSASTMLEELLKTPLVTEDFEMPDGVVIDEEEPTQEDLEETTEDGEFLSEPILVALNVLSIVSVRKFPYKVEGEDTDVVRAHWGGERPVDIYSEQG